MFNCFFCRRIVIKCTVLVGFHWLQLADVRSGEFVFFKSSVFPLVDVDIPGVESGSDADAEQSVSTSADLSKQIRPLHRGEEAPKEDEPGSRSNPSAASVSTPGRA